MMFQAGDPLLQELHVGKPDWHWRVLVICIMLNRTRRAQVETVSELFFEAFPTSSDVRVDDLALVEEIVKPLGFARKRSEILVEMSCIYAAHLYNDVSELPGVGKYAIDAYKLLCLGDMNVSPNDHALNYYHSWILGR